METATTPQPMPPQAIVMQMMTGAWVARLTGDISRIGVPDALKKHGPMTAAEMVSKGGIHAKVDSLERALRAVASLGILTENADGAFGPTELSDTLTIDSPVSVKRWSEVMCSPFFWKGWLGLEAAIRTGEPQFEAQMGLAFWPYLNANPQALEDFGEGMKSNSLNSMNGVLEHCDFSSVEKMVDVGGGFGHLALALCGKYPHLKAAVLDVADLIPVATKNLPDDPGVVSRVEFIGGNMFESVPPADAYVMKHIIHDWEDERCVRLLRNCRTSMNGDGRIFCIDAIVPPMGDASGITAKLLDMVMMTFITGKERTMRQWEDLYRAAGLRVENVTSIQDNLGTSIIEGVKA